MGLKYRFKNENANVDPSSFVQKKHLGDFKKRGQLALEIAALRALEVVDLTTKGELIGARIKKGYEFGAAYYAWQASEVATQFLRLTAETSDDKAFVRNVCDLFDFGPEYFDSIVESPYTSDWNKAHSPAFRYSDAVRRGDKIEIERASRDIADVVSQFCKIALKLAPKNREILKTLAVVRRVATEHIEYCAL